jgi:hypothetical protein
VPPSYPPPVGAPGGGGPPAQDGPSGPGPNPPPPAGPEPAELLPVAALAPEAPGPQADIQTPAGATVDAAGELLYAGPPDSPTPPSPPIPHPEPRQPGDEQAISTPDLISPGPAIRPLTRAPAGPRVDDPGVAPRRALAAGHWSATDAAGIDTVAPQADPSPSPTISRQPAQPPAGQTSGGRSTGSAGAAAGTLLTLVCGLALLGLGFFSRLRLVPDEWHTMFYLALPERPG